MHRTHRYFEKRRMDTSKIDVLTFLPVPSTEKHPACYFRIAIIVFITTRNTTFKTMVHFKAEPELNDISFTTSRTDIYNNEFPRVYQFQNEITTPRESDCNYPS